MEYLGMTGKFHTWWGEFGGYKHPNALRWEAALCLANGACCSIGDQLHPEGLMDNATYSLIGEAYKEVEEKEKWCFNTENIADIAMLSTEAVHMDSTGSIKGGSEDEGCVKILLEGNYLFDVIDLKSDFSKYKIIILPDVIRIDEKLKKLLNEFVIEGGKLLATGESGLSAEDKFVFDFGAEYISKCEYQPSFFKPNFKINSLETASFVMYSPGHHVKPLMGVEHGEFQNSYFNRDMLHFCSHQHTPPTLKRVSSGMIGGKEGIYIPWSIFSEYTQIGSYILQQMVIHALDTLLKSEKTLRTNLPAQGIVTLQHQASKNRYIQHSLYASPVLRGKKNTLEVIEDILPVINTEFTITLNKTVKKMYRAPQMDEVSFSQTDGVLRYNLKEFECHQMVVIEY